MAGDPVYMRPTTIRDQRGDPLARVAPADAEVCALELPGAAIRLDPRGAKVLAFALIEWSRKGRKLRLWGTEEVCAHAGITRVTLHRWRTDRDFPLPAAEVSGVPVWEEPVVRAWVKHRRPRRGRPSVEESKKIKQSRQRAKFRRDKRRAA